MKVLTGHKLLVPIKMDETKNHYLRRLEDSSCNGVVHVPSAQPVASQGTQAAFSLYAVSPSYAVDLTIRGRFTIYLFLRISCR